MLMQPALQLAHEKDRQHDRDNMALIAYTVNCQDWSEKVPLRYSAQ